MKGSLALALLVMAADPGSLSRLSSQLAGRLTAIYGQTERRVVRVDRERVVVAPGALQRGDELELLAEAMPLRDPETMETLGKLLEPIAAARVVTSNPRVGLAGLDWVKRTPRVGDVVRRAPRSVVLGLRPVDGDPRLESALGALCAVLPYQLERSGLFQVRRGPPLMSAMAGSPALDRLRRDAEAEGLDATLAVGLHLEQGELVLLAELVSSQSGQPVELFTARAPLDLQTRRYMTMAPMLTGASKPDSYPMGELEGPVLALERAPSRPDGSPALLALTPRGLWRLDEDVSPRRLVAFDDLERAAFPCRRPAGTLVVGHQAGAAWVAFGLNLLSRGYLWRDGSLEALEGMPLGSRDGELLLGRYRPGQDLFDGSLGLASGWRDIGPFRALRTDGPHVFVQRPDLGLERLEPGLGPGSGLELRSGDAWDTEAGTWLSTSTTDEPGDGRDRLELVAADGLMHSVGFAVPLTAVELLDHETGEVAVAEAHEGAGLVSVLRWR